LGEIAKESRDCHPQHDLESRNLQQQQPQSVTLESHQDFPRSTIDMGYPPTHQQDSKMAAAVVTTTMTLTTDTTETFPAILLWHFIPSFKLTKDFTFQFQTMLSKQFWKIKSS